MLESFSEDNTAYFPELGRTNPFLHMGLHLALREQIVTDRPVGIKAVFQQLLSKLGDPLVVEHKMMEPLMECLWQAQRDQCLPNDKQYIVQLTVLVNDLA